MSEIKTETNIIDNAALGGARDARLALDRFGDARLALEQARRELRYTEGRVAPAMRRLEAVRTAVQTARERVALCEQRLAAEAERTVQCLVRRYGE